MFGLRVVADGGVVIDVFVVVVAVLLIEALLLRIGLK